MVLRSARWLGGGTGTGLPLGDDLDMPEPRMLLRRLMAQVSGRLSIQIASTGSASAAEEG